jgi:hypothetical protein
MTKVRLIHWKAEEVEERAARVRAAGFPCDASPFGPRYGEELRKTPPGIYLIDLSRLPSHGREAGAYLRSSRAQGHVPVVFVDGAPEKITTVRKLLPDAIYCSWRGIKGALTKASKQRLAPKKAPPSSSGPYSSTPLWKKLGLKPGGTLALSGAPKELAETSFSDLPVGCTIRVRASGSPNVVLWFVRSRAQLRRQLPKKRKFAQSAGLWVAWPKQASEVATDLNRDFIRRLLLDDGLVDIKVCAIDATWSGMRYAFPRS